MNIALRVNLSSRSIGTLIADVRLCIWRMTLIKKSIAPYIPIGELTMDAPDAGKTIPAKKQAIAIKFPE